MIGTWNLGWTQHNAVRRYPLTESSSATDVSGTFRIPNDFLIGLYLTVPVALANSPAGFYIHTLGAYQTGYYFTIAFGTTEVAAATIPAASHTKYSPYRLQGLGPYEDVIGHAVIGSLDEISKQPYGLFEFDEAGASIEPDCIRPSLRAVSSIRIRDGVTMSQPITGDVVLAAGSNIKFTVDSYSQSPATIIRIDAIAGEGLFSECNCESAQTLNPIRRINGSGPTPTGDFAVMGTECAQIQAIPNGIRLADTCAKPCCGPKELETITAALETLRRQIATLDKLTAGLEQRVGALDAAVFASKFGDGGCTNCG